jgi:hypothetical protein
MTTKPRALTQRIRRPVGRVLRGAGLRSKPQQLWVVDEPEPSQPAPLHDFRLFAIVGAWMEEDVIAATVANARTQGCERVYLVDNASPDETVREAVAAGAIHAATFWTPHYDEVLRLKIMNHVVHTVSAESGAEHIWWLWIDADEFPHAPGGATIREFLERLDRRFRIVGGRFINHFPTGEPAYRHGHHPLDFQPLCEEHREPICDLGHRKHPLQRFDRNRPPIIADRGFHRATSAERPLREPVEALYVHHFPYREEDVTRRRLAALCAADDRGNTRARQSDDATDGMVPRFETLDAVYAGDWARVRNYRADGRFATADPVPWNSLVSPADAVSKRWYSVETDERAAQ